MRADYGLSKMKSRRNLYAAKDCVSLHRKIDIFWQAEKKVLKSGNVSFSGTHCLPAWVS